MSVSRFTTRCEITEAIKGLVGTTQGQVFGRRPGPAQLAAEAAEAASTAWTSRLHNVDKITGRMAEGEGTVGHLLTDDTVAKNLDNITDDISGITRGVNDCRRSWACAWNTITATTSSRTCRSIGPASDKFYLIELGRSTRLSQRSKHSGLQLASRAYSNEEITTSDKLRFSFMFGKRWGPFQAFWHQRNRPAVWR